MPASPANQLWKVKSGFDPCLLAPDCDVVLALDFETFWAKDYTLKKMRTWDYVTDPRFKVHGVALRIFQRDRVGGFPAIWLDGRGDGHDAFTDLLDGLNAERTAVLAHHAGFDGSILVHRYGFRPGQWLCSMSMAQGAWGHVTGGVSLDACCEFLDLPTKDHAAIANTCGVVDLPADTRSRLIRYALKDVDHAVSVAGAASSSIDNIALTAIHATIEMRTNPRLVLDVGRLSSHLAAVRERKASALDRAGLSAAELQSSERLAGWLMARGVDPPTKVSPTTGQVIWAFAKSDEGMKELLEHDDEDVQAVAAARLNVRSTIEETRTVALLEMARNAWLAGRAAMPLRYAAAHTGRWGGTERVNMQNLTRVDPRKPGAGEIRAALAARTGETVITADLSQIEARMLAWLAGQQDLVDAFAAGEDIYCQFASTLFGREITPADKIERQVGKVAILQLGFGSGWRRFEATLRQAGVDLIALEQGHGLVPKAIVNAYRERYAAITAMWADATVALDAMEVAQARDHIDLALESETERRFRLGHEMPRTFTPRVIGVAASEHGRANVHANLDHVRLHRGTKLHYRDLTRDLDGQMSFGPPKRRRRIYGSKLVENIVQASAFDVIATKLKRVRDETGQLPVLQVHDDLIYVMPKRAGDGFAESLYHAMNCKEFFWPGLPIASEVSLGRSYGELRKMA